MTRLHKIRRHPLSRSAAAPPHRGRQDGARDAAPPLKGGAKKKLAFPLKGGAKGGGGLFCGLREASSSLEKIQSKSCIFFGDMVE